MERIQVNEIRSVAVITQSVRLLYLYSNEALSYELRYTSWVCRENIPQNAFFPYFVLQYDRNNIYQTGMR